MHEFTSWDPIERRFRLLFSILIPKDQFILPRSARIIFEGNKMDAIITIEIKVKKLVDRLIARNHQFLIGLLFTCLSFLRCSEVGSREPSEYLNDIKIKAGKWAALLGNPILKLIGGKAGSTFRWKLNENLEKSKHFSEFHRRWLWLLSPSHRVGAAAK